MRSNRGLVVSICVFALVVEAAAAASCGSSGMTSTAGNTGGSSNSTGTHTGTGGMTSTGTQGIGGNVLATGTGGGLGGCTDSSQCNGGVCNNGSCCPSASDVCGSQCCTGATVCLFGGCVTPGNACTSAADCAAGQYCETALGDNLDGGPGIVDAGADGGVCTEALPLNGKCLPSPVVCAADAGAGGSGSGADGGCVPDCEYHPPFNLALSVEARWTWGPTALAKPTYTDIWASPVVGRVYDTNCDGKVDSLDDPVVIFVAGNDYDNAAAGSNCQGANVSASGSSPSMCHTGALRMLDGNTGEEIWTVDAIPGSIGFAGTSVAIGDVDGDGFMDIVAVTGEGYVVMLDRYGNLERKSNVPVGTTAADEADVAFGWGGGVALADMEGTGFPDIAFGATVFSTTGGAITLKFAGTGGIGGGSLEQALSTFVNLDPTSGTNLDLLAGNTAYTSTGAILWQRAGLPDGFPAVGDFNGAGQPQVVLVGPVAGQSAIGNQANVWILDGATGATLLGPVQLPTTVHPSDGGPPTVADFDGDGSPEIGVATADYYWVLKPDFTNNKIDIVWKMPNHDYSSSVTGSTVFDFEGAGHPSVVYADECYLWVFDGATGAVRFAAPHTSFTGTEASLLADVAGDGHAELLMVSNGASPTQWGCLDANGAPVVINGVTWTPNPQVSNKAYRGLVLFGDTASSWVNTRTLWNEHTYHVSNICDDSDNACPPPNVYGSIPKVETSNWTLPWLNNFRQNVQDQGIFNAPQAVVALTVACATPVVGKTFVRNIGLAPLPAGVTVGLFVQSGGNLTQVGQGITSAVLLPGQTEEVDIAADPTMSNQTDTFVAQIIISPTMPLFHECDPSNNSSAPVTPQCVM